MSYYCSYLNYETHFRHVQRIKHYLGLRPFIVLIYGKSLTIIYIFIFFLVFKLYKSSLYVIHIISDHLIFWGQCWNWRLFSSGIFWKVNLNSCSSFRCFFLWLVNCTCQACIWDHAHGQCFIQELLIMA